MNIVSKGEDGSDVGRGFARQIFQVFDTIYLGKAVNWQSFQTLFITFKFYGAENKKSPPQRDRAIPCGGTFSQAFCLFRVRFLLFELLIEPGEI